MAIKVYPKSISAKKRVSRQRRAMKARKQIRTLQVKNPELVRLTVYRSNKHISAQLIKYSALDGQSHVIAMASSKESGLVEQCKNTGNIEAARLVGKSIAEKAKALNIDNIAFDRSGYLYHGRVAALADAARENGLQF